MNLWGRKCSPHPTPPPSWLLPLPTNFITSSKYRSLCGCQFPFFFFFFGCQLPQGINLGQFFSITGQWIFKAFLQPLSPVTQPSFFSFLSFLFLFTSEVPGVEFDSLPYSIIAWARKHWRPKIPFRVNMLCFTF